MAAVETPDPRRVVFRLHQAVARFPHLLFQRHRRRLDRAEEVCRERRRGRLQEGADRRRPLQVRLVHPGRRTGDGGVRRLLAQGAHREEAGLEGDPGRDHAARGAEARRGRYRLLDPRRAGRGVAAHTGARAEAGGDQLAVLDLFRRPVGPEIALARSRGCARPRPWRSIARASTRRSRSAIHCSPAASCRRTTSSTGSRRRSRTIRRRRAGCWRKRASKAASMPASTTATPPTPTSARRRSTACEEVGIRVKLRPIERAAFNNGVCREEISQPHPGRQRRLRQRRDADGDLRRQGRRLCLWQLPRHRRAVRPAGGGNRSRQTRTESCIACSSWCTSARCTRRSGSSPSSTARAGGSAESAFGLISGHPYSAPYEEVRLKNGA